MFKFLKNKISSLFSSFKIDEEFFEELEDTLIEGDLGPALTYEVIEKLRAEAKANKITTQEELRACIKEILGKYVFEYDEELEVDELNVYLILGVNGVGKTTSIAKMASYYSAKGKSVVLAAADTFRAAAVDQLDIHAERLGVRIVKQSTGSDPGAVVFDAVTSAMSKKDDLVLVDTAGRMHNKENLMNELSKINKIISNKGVKSYKKFIVLDATTGQNCVSQALLFDKAVQIDGLILTKYDSAAKGGALVQLGQKLNLPIAFVGVGETYKDLKKFNKEDFLNSLIGN